MLADWSPRQTASRCGVSHQVRAFEVSMAEEIVSSDDGAAVVLAAVPQVFRAAGTLAAAACVLFGYVRREGLYRRAGFSESR